MADHTPIEWTDATWNPIRARNLKTGGVGHFCVHASPGCQFCYAERQQPRFRNPIRYAAQDRKTVEVFLDEKKLLEPLRWREPRMIFPCSMTDLFGDWVTDEMLDRVFAVMALCPQHTFQILTKRAERIREYLNDPSFGMRVGGELMNAARGHAGAEAYVIDLTHRLTIERKPLPNVWLGVSVEDQERADHRIPILLDTPAALRWISAEPLLGPVDISRWLDPFRQLDADHKRGIARGMFNDDQVDDLRQRILDWIVVGGESGPRARPFDIGWARSIIAQCKAANVPVFVKQLGARVYDDSRKADMPPFPADAEPEDIAAYTRGFTRVYFNHGKGGNPAEWPEDLRVREFPEIRRAAA